MTRLRAASVSRVETTENPLLTPDRAPQPDALQPAEIFAEGVHEAVFRVLNGSSIKERVEEVVLARQSHLRPGETVTLIEHAKDDVIHQQFHTLLSVQALLADLKRRGIEADVRLRWGN